MVEAHLTSILHRQVLSNIKATRARVAKAPLRVSCNSEFNITEVHPEQLGSTNQGKSLLFHPRKRCWMCLVKGLYNFDCKGQFLGLHQRVGSISCHWWAKQCQSRSSMFDLVSRTIPLVEVLVVLHCQEQWVRQINSPSTWGPCRLSWFVMGVIQMASWKPSWYLPWSSLKLAVAAIFVALVSAACRVKPSYPATPFTFYIARGCWWVVSNIVFLYVEVHIMHLYIYIQLCIYIYVHICISIHIYIHTFMYICDYRLL